MTKQIIATLVGAVILFLWQFLSWAIIQLHSDETQYTPNQDAILTALAENNLEPGHYFLPNVPPGTPFEEQEALMAPYMGKPWATISYHPSMENNMTLNLMRGFAVDLVATWLLVWLLLQFAESSLGKSVLAAVAVGVISYLVFPYTGSIWYETPSLGYLVDAIVPFALMGAWLGWYLNRK